MFLIILFKISIESVVFKYYPQKCIKTCEPLPNKQSNLSDGLLILRLLLHQLRAHLLHASAQSFYFLRVELLILRVLLADTLREFDVLLRRLAPLLVCQTAFRLPTVREDALVHNKVTWYLY